MLVGVSLAVIGLQSFFFGCLAQIFCDYSGAARVRWTRVFRYTRTVSASLAVLVIGLGFEVALLVSYVTHGLRLPTASSSLDHLAVTGLLFMIVGFSSFCFTLLLHATGVRYGLRAAVPAPEPVAGSDRSS